MRPLANARDRPRITAALLADAGDLARIVRALPANALTGRASRALLPDLCGRGAIGVALLRIATAPTSIPGYASRRGADAA